MEQDKRIELIVHTTTSATDVNGNRYHRCYFTLTATHETLVVGSMGGDDNGRHLARESGLEWEQIYSVNETIGKRDWKRIDQHRPSDCYEHEALPLLEAMLARARGQAVPV